jgi:hypothetical protein
MTVGVFFVALVIVAVIIIVTRLVRPGRKAEPPPPTEDPLAALRARYDALYILYEIPGNAMEVRLACAGKSGGLALRFYCWLKDDELMLFPYWDSVQAVGLPTDPDHFQVELWRISTESILCYAMQQGLPGRFAVLQFKTDSEVLSLAFPEDAYRVFATLLPDKDLSHLLEEMYPKSSRNIQDIKESFVSLKELRGEDLITEDEYAAKKKEMLISM